MKDIQMSRAPTKDIHVSRAPTKDIQIWELDSSSELIKIIFMYSPTRFSQPVILQLLDFARQITILLFLDRENRLYLIMRNIFIVCL
jgi:hypothetical protein